MYVFFSQHTTYLSKMNSSKYFLGGAGANPSMIYLTHHSHIIQRLCDKGSEKRERK